MSYVVLARKWRPQTFEDLVGQEHVSRTLANAIASDRVAHAFLFTGVRGVGKTTSARILAKALNCQNGPTATPCLQCSPCKEIGDGSDVDVQEIDGASYTGVDEVRRLQESLPYRPARDRFKIYIVDEVHMLSQNAWNAFLKTLEEPPPHVKFIFATTEVNKVPITILSRCQRYDFKLIRLEDITARLAKVLEAEAVEADEAALNIISREAAGSMRDAMSLLDQVIAWVGGSGDRLSADGVARVLGVAARSVLHRLGEALVDGDAGACLDVVAELAAQGYGLHNVARDFLAHLRDLVVAKVSPEPKHLLELADSELADVLALAKRTSEQDLSRLYLAFSRSFDDIARSAQPRSAFEMALVRLSQRPPLVALDELLERLADMERRIAGGPGAGSASSGSSGSGGQRPAGGARPARAPRDQAWQSAAPPKAAPAPALPKAAPAPAPPLPKAAPAPALPKAAPAPAPALPTAAPAPKAASSPTPSSPPPSAKPQHAEQREHWRGIIQRVAAARPALASVFEHATPLSVAPERVVLSYPPSSFLAQQASDAEAQRILTAAAREHFDAQTEVELDFSGRHGEVETLAAKNSAEHQARLAAAKQRVAEHPLVAAAIRELGAELRDVRLPTDSM